MLRGSYQFAEGRFVVKAFPVREHVGVHPGVGRLLPNMIRYGEGFVGKPLAETLVDFEAQLKAIGHW